MAISVSREQLNFIVAISAILISVASFYVAYLQANSAEQQVKAMTWPLIEFTHGNYDVETREKRLTLTLKNAGVGPAIVKSVSFEYQGDSLPSYHHFVQSCCEKELDQYLKNVREQKEDIDAWTLTTSVLDNTILPVGGEVEFLSLVNHPGNRELWNAVNKARWDLQLNVCFCSLLENCYITDRPGSVSEVAQCPNPGGEAR